MAELSPQAQAVLDACDQAFNQCGTTAQGLAAALRAAADQVVPVCSTKSDRGVQRMMMRNDLLIIAAELEGAQ